MPKLKVHQIAKVDVYKDIVRIPEVYRIDKNGEPIEESTVCWIEGTVQRSVAALRGYTASTGPEIHMDERTRNRLGVKFGDQPNFTFIRAGLWGKFVWAWKASETGYRVASRLAVFGLFLGIVGLFLGVLAVVPVVKEWVK